MLKKLFKYDWKSYWKVPATANLFLFIITVVGVVSLVSPFWKQKGKFIEVLMASSIMLYILIIFAVSIGVSIYIAIRFYKNIYTDEGYLTNTLPVTPRQIILSKMFTGAIWCLITSIMVCFSASLIIITAFSSYENIIIQQIADLFREASLLFRQETGMGLTGFIGFMIIYFIIGCFFSILMMYAAVSLGQLFTGHKVMGAVIWYIAEYMIVQTGTSLLSNLMLVLPGIRSGLSTSAIDLKPLLFTVIILTMIINVIFFFLSEYMLKKKLNLD